MLFPKITPTKEMLSQSDKSPRQQGFITGAGAARQSAPFDVDKAISVAGQVPMQASTPLGWARMLAIGVTFIMCDWEAMANLVGVPTWSRAQYPCPLCDATRDNMHEYR